MKIKKIIVTLGPVEEIIYRLVDNKNNRSWQPYLCWEFCLALQVLTDDLLLSSLKIHAGLNGSVSLVITGAFSCGSSILKTFLLSLAFFSSRLQSLFTSLGPWALRNGRQSCCVLSIFYEKRWAQNLDDLRQELNIEQPPVILGAAKKQKTPENGKSTWWSFLQCWTNQKHFRYNTLEFF